tara:strand:- start:950 stop:1408 length:459 start_codon:yes stop_codon:yes gene_type:complete
MIINVKKKLYLLILSIFIIILDQFTKNIIFNYYDKYLNKDFYLFKIDFVKNYGAAFNIFSGNIIFLSFTSVIFSIILIYLILRKNNTKFINYLSYSFILAGAVGNGIDRLVNGYVIDFINLNIINFPVFNIADISINIGFILILYSFFKGKK